MVFIVVECDPRGSHVTLLITEFTLLCVPYSIGCEMHFV